MKRFGQILVLVAAIIGLVDSGYLTYEHFLGDVAQCKVIPIIGPLLGDWLDCGKVLTSSYSSIGPIPLASLGLVFYVGVFGWGVWSLFYEEMMVEWRTKLGWLMGLTGVVVSGYLVYIQLGIIRSICLYCMISAFNSVIVLVSVGMMNLGSRQNRGTSVEIEETRTESEKR